MSGTDFALKGREFLAQAGVKGMRWGVRRSQAELDRAAGRKPEKSESDSRPKNASAFRRTNPGSLSDAELKAAVNRMNLEQQMARLQPTPLSRRAANFAASVATNVARTQLTNALNQQVTGALQSHIQSSGGSSVSWAPPRPPDRRA